MGKGDKKSRRGKIVNKSYGVTRPSRMKKASPAKVKEVKKEVQPKKTVHAEKAKPVEPVEAVVIESPVVETPVKETPVKETPVKETPEVKKPTAKKTAAKKDPSEAKAKAPKTKKKEE